jgi:hypothetical protein
MSTIASSTYDSGLFCNNLIMSKDLKHSITASGYFCSTFFSSKKLKILIKFHIKLGALNIYSRGIALLEIS